MRTKQKHLVKQVGWLLALALMVMPMASAQDFGSLLQNVLNDVIEDVIDDVLQPGVDSQQGQENDDSLFAPRSIQVTPNAPAAQSGLEFWLDRAPQNTTAVYPVGSPMTMYVRPGADSYLYLFSINSAGSVTQLFPTPQAPGENWVTASQLQQFATRSNVEGQYTLIAVTSSRTLNQDELTQARAAAVQPAGGAASDSFAQTRAISVTQNPVTPAQGPWQTAALQVTIQNANTVAPTSTNGRLQVVSQPVGAAVYVDSSFIGYSPTDTEMSSGAHTLRIERQGYDSIERAINVVSGQTLRAEVQLTQVQVQPRSGTILIRCNTPGAQLFVDGKAYGTFAGNGLARVSNVPSGSYEVTIVAADHRTHVQEVSVIGDTEITVNLARR